MFRAETGTRPASLSTVECLGIADPVISMGAVGDALCVGEVWAAACSDGSASVVYVLPESPFFDVLLDDVGGFFLPFSARKFRHLWNRIGGERCTRGESRVVQRGVTLHTCDGELMVRWLDTNTTRQ